MTTKTLYPEGLLGKKLGMTQVFTADGQCVPVTAIQVGPCYILDVKTPARDGYAAVQLGFEPKKTQRVNKPLMGHMAKAGKGAFYHIKEVRCDADSLGWTNLGQELKVQDVFEEGAMVDVSGVTIGKGFQGVFRRFNNAGGQPATRGTHEYKRHLGSIGNRKFPGRVFKNKKMPGRMGNANVTMQNLKVVGVNADEGILLVKGGIPGNRGGLVVIKKAMKSFGSAKKNAA
jgi:large subunit ribosomal protein L3